ncbi:DUF3951 domain-containing protein [Thalassobacillus hwangdonensis]|uniref:DUF3951 domain-containing protein n=2 Tax=Thalassobacillus hwangdonensis TaxID=546108 RepID=A0ABW3L1E2_9BACI
MIIIIVLVLVVAFKIFVKKERPTNYYTPFDHIAGQTNKEFHEESEVVEEEEDDEKGDDKDK